MADLHNPNTAIGPGFAKRDACLESIDLQRRLDDFALRIDGDDQLLIWEARSAIANRDQRLAKIRDAAG